MPDQLHYCVQCTDVGTGKTGTFVYDPVLYEASRQFHAVGEIFPSLVELFAWARQNGYASQGYEFVLYKVPH